MRTLSASFLSIFSILFLTLLGAPASATAQTTTLPITVAIDDQADLLTPEDEAKLTEDTTRVQLPDAVRTVNFVTFPTNDDLLNDTVRFYAADHGLQDASGEYFADGHFIIAIGMDPRRVGAFAGQDVAEALHLLDPNGDNGQDMDRYNAINQEMKPLLTEEKWAQGMLRGVQAAADPDLLVKNDSGDGDDGAGWLVGGGIGALGALVAGLAISVVRQQKIKKAKDNYAYILGHHGDVAGRLDAIDVRAHSLSSPLANDVLRREWADIRDKFLAAHSAIDKLGELSSSSPNKEFSKRANDLTTAREAVEEVVNAEANIEHLARMEHGDAEVRRSELTSLHQDALAAVAKAKGEAVHQLKAIDSRILALREQLDRPDFMDIFADILGDYSALIEVVKEQLYAESKVEPRDHETVSLGSRDWHPGVGYYYVPFSTVDEWHSSDLSHHESQSSSSSSSGYSSGGFSGSGASSSF